MFANKLFSKGNTFLQFVKFQFSSKPLPAETYYPVIDTRTYQIHKYHDKITNIAKKLQLSKNSINQRKRSKKNKEDIHQGTFKNFLINQIKQDSQSLVRKKEIILVGRSNVGKSSLINNLFDVKDLSLVSRKTGSTQKLKYYEFDHNYGYLIDTPGYGYSKINVEAQRKNQGMILDYLKISTRCVRIFMLINAEHGIQISDMAFLYRTSKFNLNTQIILTKSDKVPENKLNDKILAIGMQLKRFKHINPIIHATSSKDKFGIEQVKNAIAESLMFHKQREIPAEHEEEVLKYLERQYRLKQQYLDRKCLEYYTRTKPMQKLMQLEEKQTLKKSLVLKGSTPHSKKSKLFIQKN